MNTIDQVLRTQYQSEWVQDFERTKAKLRQCVMSTGVPGAETVYFPVIMPGDEAVEKARDGSVPTSDLDLEKVAATVRKHHKKYRIDNFDAFRAMADVRQGMSIRGIPAINRAIDRIIIQQLDTATTNMGAATILSTLAEVQEWTETLWNADVPDDDGKVWGLVTRRAWNQMMRINEFKSMDYTTQKVVDTAIAYKSWMGVKWMVHNGLTGRGTASAKCYIFHESAVGHMINGDPRAVLFQNEEDDYFGVRFEVMHAAKLILQTGVVQYLHNDTTALT